MPSLASEVLRLVPYALIATLSPLGFAATLAVMGSGRVKALIFAFGFVAGQLTACAVLVVIGTAAVPAREQSHPTLRALSELALGVALVWLAVSVRRRPRPTGAASSGRSKAALERLERLHIATALVAGLLLGIGGPKRFVLTALAAVTITDSGVSNSQQALLVIWYALLATLLVWVPVIAFELFGDRVVGKLGVAQHWLSQHQRTVVFYVLLVFGLLLLADGAAALL